MKINLDRKFSFFNIDRETPHDLIIFLMKSTGKTLEKEKIEKKFEKIKNYLDNYENFLIAGSDYCQEDLGKISCFVSDTEETWTVKNLLDSFTDLLSFYNNFKVPDLNKIKFGSRSDDKPYSYDICMTYILAKKLKIHTERDDTLDSLRGKILNLNIEKQKSLNLIKNNLFKLNDLEIYYIIQSLKLKEEEKKELNTVSLEKLSKNININYIIKKSVLSNEEAIVYAAKFFNYDITDSSYPISVLNSITNKREDNINFEIKDNFVRKFNLNPKFFKLDKFWKERLKFLYSPKTLNSLKVYENLEEDETLEKKYLQDNFYDGIVEFENDIDDTERIISFGNFMDKNFEVRKVSYFLNFFEDELGFGKYEKNIEKLVNICRENEYISLHKKIRYIQKYYSMKDENILQLKTLKEENKEIIKEFFTKLYEISELLKDKEAVDDLDNISIMNSILNLNSYASEIKNEKVKEKLQKIPLIEYKNEIFCKNKENYYSKILEDLTNIKNLKDKTKEYLQSKHKLYSVSSYYYLYVFYKENLFQLDN